MKGIRGEKGPAPAIGGMRGVGDSFGCPSCLFLIVKLTESAIVTVRWYHGLGLYMLEGSHLFCTRAFKVRMTALARHVAWCGSGSSVRDFTGRSGAFDEEAEVKGSVGRRYVDSNAISSSKGRRSPEHVTNLEKALTTSR